jgi:hypothetical protein
VNKSKLSVQQDRVIYYVCPPFLSLFLIQRLALMRPYEERR